MSKLYACIISADAKNDKAVLLSIADEFASGIEVLEDGVLFDVSGLEKLMGDADEIARRIENKLKQHNLQANAAVAASADTAILLARQNERLARTAKADEFSRLALRELDIDPDTLDIFDDLGIRKISDLLRVPVVRPRTTETTALGAAFLAGLAVGFWKDQAEIASLWSADQTFRAKARPADVARLRRGWDEAVRCTRSWSHPIETPARRRR